MDIGRVTTVLESSTGDVPDLGADVAVDHVLAVGSHRMTGGKRVVYRDAVPGTVAPYLRPALIGERLAGSMPNGDFVCRLEDVRRGTLRATRSKPVAA